MKIIKGDGSDAEEEPPFDQALIFFFLFPPLPALFCIRVGIKQAWQLFEGLASFSAAWANGVLSTEPDSQLQLCVCVCVCASVCVMQALAHGVWSACVCVSPMRTSM